MREGLLAGLRERVERFAETGDASGILSRTAELECDALLGPNAPTHLASIATVAELRWLRYSVSEPDDDTRPHDLQEALRLYAHVQELDSAHEVPGPVRLLLECRDAH